MGTVDSINKACFIKATDFHIKISRELFFLCTPFRVRAPMSFLLV